MNRSSPPLRTPRLSVLLLPGLVACGEAAVEAELLLPEEVSVGWERAYNGRDDGLGALVPVDVMVYEGTTGNPLPGVLVEVWTDDVATWPVPVDEVWLMPAETSEELDAEVELPGRVRAWDATRDQFVSFDPVDGIELVTDEGGVARLYLYVDAFPVSEGGPSEDGTLEDIRVLVSMSTEGDPVLDGLWLTPR